MISESFFEKDVETIMVNALKQIPENSRYAKSVRKTIKLFKKYSSYEKAYNEYFSSNDSTENFDCYDDAGIVNLSLLYGKGNFEKTLLLTASYGSDTDCNCASVGALLGCIYGANAIPEKWITPIGDNFTSDLGSCKISELTKRICKAGRECIKFHAGGMHFTTDI